MKDNENGNKKKKQTAIDRFLGNDRVMSIIVLLGLAGIALIFISSALDPGKNEDTVPQQEINASDFSADDYKNESIVFQDIDVVLPGEDNWQNQDILGASNTVKTKITAKSITKYYQDGT